MGIVLWRMPLAFHFDGNDVFYRNQNIFFGTLSQTHCFLVKQCKVLEQCDFQSQGDFMSQSTITDKFRTTIPVDVREALHLSPRQRIAYEVRPDGSAILRPVPRLDELFGSVKLGRRAASVREEKAAARSAMARETSRNGSR